jgi:nucleotide-binding universal stress UspA family protein
MTTSTIVVGVDGSEHSARAVAWCAQNAPALDAEVVAIHALETPVYAAPGMLSLPYPPLGQEQRDELRDVVSRDWCKALADAGVPYRALLVEGSPTIVLIDAARAENAALVVVGRRGRGGFAELVLGSTSHQLTHHLDRPLVIVP